MGGFGDTDKLLGKRIVAPEKKPKRRRGKRRDGSTNPNVPGEAHRRQFQGDRKPRGVVPSGQGLSKDQVDKLRRQFDIQAKKKVDMYKRQNEKLKQDLERCMEAEFRMRELQDELHSKEGGAC